MHILHATCACACACACAYYTVAGLQRLGGGGEVEYGRVVVAWYGALIDVDRVGVGGRARHDA